MGRTRKDTSRIWVNELDDLIRGASGGFLFGIPLLYTMEVWWIGSSARSLRLLLAVLLTGTIVYLLNRTAGFRKTNATDTAGALMDTVEAIAIGIVCTLVVLVLLREITLETPFHETLGKLIYESMPFTLGVSLANQFLSEEQERRGEPAGGSEKPQGKQDELNATLSDIGATMIGAMIIAFNIAPTDEIALLSSAIDGFWLLAILVAALVISYGIVFEAGFANQKKRQQQQGIFQRPLSETLISYLVSLLSAMAMLFFFDKLQLSDPWQMWLSYTLILGLPATIGGAAGRLAI